MAKDLMALLREKKNAMGRGNRTIRPSKDRNLYRILPNWLGDAEAAFYHDFGQHFIKDAAGDLKAVYMCVDKTYGRPCDICDQISKGIMHSTDDAVIKALENGRSSGRILLNVLDLEGDNPGQPQVLEVGSSIFGSLLTLFDEWGTDLIDLEKGQNIVIHKAGSGLTTKYSVQIAAKSLPVKSDVMKKIVNLDDFVAQESEEVARRALGAVSGVAGLLSRGGAGAMKTLTVSDVPADSVETLNKEQEDDLASVDGATTVEQEDDDSVEAMLAGLED
jgi:hypothetical protein